MLSEQRLSPTLLEALSTLIADRLGLHFPVERQPELAHALALMASQCGLVDATACAHWLIHSTLTAEQIEKLAGYLTVGETYFFREGRVFSRLEAEILPALIEGRRNRDKRLRIWSAACSSGEEPYSIAMLLDHLLPDRKEWEITIRATDINPVALEQARLGLYREWSFRQAPYWLKQTYFKARGDRNYEIAGHLKRQVSFEQLNLAADVYPSVLNNTCAMDLIFCRNVLMYFTPECARLTVDRLSRCLNDEGWLIVGQAELSQIHSSALHPVHFGDAVVYRRDNSLTMPANLATEPLPPVFADRLPAKEPPVIEPPPTLPVEKTPVPAPVEEHVDYGDAVSFFHRGKYWQAERGLLRLLATQPEETQALSLLARCVAEQGRFAEARRWCEQAIAGDQLDPALHYLLAAIAAGRGANEDAMVALRCALFLDPGFVMAHFAWGELAEQSGHVGEAVKHYTNARRLLQARAPSDPLAEGDGLTAGRLMEVIDRKQLQRGAI